MKNLFILGVTTPQEGIFAAIICLSIFMVGYTSKQISQKIEDSIVVISEATKIEWWDMIKVAIMFFIGAISFIVSGYNLVIVVLIAIWLAIIIAMVLILYKERETRAIPTLFMVGILVVFIIIKIQLLWLVFAVAFFLGLFIEETLKSPVEKIVKNIKKTLGLS